MASPKFVSVATIAVVVLFSLANAQINEGTVVGTVRDGTSAVVAGARVSITNTDTDVSSSTVTNDTGEYIVRNLVPGHYSVTCTQPGFVRELFNDLTLRAGTVSRIDFTLQVGEVQQQIAVTSDAPLLQTENAAVGGSITNKSVVELPLLGRLALDL